MGVGRVILLSVEQANGCIHFFSMNAAPLPSTDDVTSIARLLGNWGLWRDTGRWDELRDAYAPQARMKTTWFSGLAVDFIEACMAAASKEAVVLHAMGPSTIEVCGDRAVAETRVTLLVCDTLEAEEVDVTCYARFVDHLIRRDNGWAILSRAPIYEKDCIAAVRPGSVLLSNFKNIHINQWSKNQVSSARSPGGAGWIAND